MSLITPKSSIRFALFIFGVIVYELSWAQDGGFDDEIIVQGTIQTDPAMSAWNAGDYVTAEIEFKKNAFCALRAQRNFQSAVESAQQSSIDANTTTIDLSSAANASTSNGSTGNAGAATNSATRLNNNNFKNEISATKRTCNNRGFQIFMSGLSQLKLGKREDAKTSFERALVIRGDLFDAHFRLGLMEYQDGDLKKARKHFKKLKRLEAKYKKGNAKDEIRAQIEYLKSILG